MPPQRRASDRKPVQLIGWLASLLLAGALTYTFVRALIDGPEGIDPLFFGLQTLASLLFLVYSVRLKNRIFVAANAVALINAAGTLLLVVTR